MPTDKELVFITAFDEDAPDLPSISIVLKQSEMAELVTAYVIVRVSGMKHVGDCQAHFGFSKDPVKCQAVITKEYGLVLVADPMDTGHPLPSESLEVELMWECFDTLPEGTGVVMSRHIKAPKDGQTQQVKK